MKKRKKYGILSHRKIVTHILIVCDIIFCMQKHITDDFSRFFERTFTVSPPFKKFPQITDYVFARMKK
jgi:hypothetical protein